MNTAIFIRTHYKDWQWLAYCLQSLRKYAHGFSEIVVATPDYKKTKQAVDLRKCRLVEVTQDHWDDYIGQQITKVCADHYCPDAHFVLHIDSDCVATRNFSAAEFFDGPLPLMTYRDWKDSGTASVWRDITELVVGFDQPHEHMAQLPIIHDVITLGEFRHHLCATHQGFGSAVEYLSQVPALSEYNAVGAFAHRFTPEAYSWRRADPATDGYPRPLKQFWSHGGITPAIEAEIHRYLS